MYQRSADACPGLPWPVLAAIGKVETNHGRLRAPGVTEGANFAGAAGPMQMGIGVGAAGDAFWRFAIDGDGKASPYDPADAIPSASAYLCKALRDNGGEVSKAVSSYNHAQWYVDKVLAIASSHAATATLPAGAQGRQRRRRGPPVRLQPARQALQVRRRRRGRLLRLLRAHAARLPPGRRRPAPPGSRRPNGTPARTSVTETVRMQRVCASSGAMKSWNSPRRRTPGLCGHG